MVQTWDVIIGGGGIIGLSLSIALRRSGASVLVLERGEPAREASYAAAGMLAALDPETPAELREFARASAALYPEFVRELEDSSGINVDLRCEGTLFIGEDCGLQLEALSPPRLKAMEPAAETSDRPVYYLEEQTVDPRSLGAAALATAKHLGVDIHGGTPVRKLIIANGRVAGVSSDRAAYHAPVFVNCCGAWACEIEGLQVPTRPVKGQMLDVIPPRRNLLTHVVRAPEVYVLPRSDGRIIIGATVEEAGFDKRVQPETIQRLHQAAANLVPELGEARIHEAWAGLRPGTPDDLPILGMTSLPGYYAATGHFRNGILLAPITGACMAELIQGRLPELDLSHFAPQRFTRIEELKRSG
jgi:glycine oxidase